MLFAKTLALGTFLSAACVSALPDLTAFARDAENEIYARDMAEMGLARREDHPSPDMVRREVEDLVRRTVPGLLSRMPHVDCSTILPTCDTNAECTAKSGECTYCGPDRKCTENPPASAWSSDSSSSDSSGTSGRQGGQRGSNSNANRGSQRGSNKNGNRGSQRGSNGKGNRGSQRGGGRHV